MNDELDKALERAKSIDDMAHSFGVEIGRGDTKHISILAAAVRSLRETVKEREEEIADLRERVDYRDKEIAALKVGTANATNICDELRRQLRVVEVNPSLDQALNENDGVYKP